MILEEISLMLDAFEMKFKVDSFLKTMSKYSVNPALILNNIYVISKT